MSQYGKLCQSVTNTVSYEKAEEKYGEYGEKYFLVGGADLRKVFVVMEILYLENRLDGNTQRDMAHLLHHVLEHSMEYKEE
jgi:hypothetical protein